MVKPDTTKPCTRRRTIAGLTGYTCSNVNPPREHNLTIVEHVDLQYYSIRPDLTTCCGHICCSSDRQAGATRAFKGAPILFEYLHCRSTSILHNSEMYGMLPGVCIPSSGIPDRYLKLFHVSIHSRLFFWFFAWEVLPHAWRAPTWLGAK